MMGTKLSLLAFLLFAWACGLRRAEDRPEQVDEMRVTDRVLPVGLYSNMEFTEEHAYGYDVNLWKHKGSVVGHFLSSNGLAGDTPVGLLENVKFDEATGSLSFTAKLSCGQRMINESDSEPTRDLFEFNGKLTDTLLTGTLTLKDGLENFSVSSSTAVVLNRTDRGDPLASYNTIEEWNEMSNAALEFRGPKW